MRPGSDPAAGGGNNREGGGGGGSSGLNTITNPDLVGKQVVVSLGHVAMVTDAPSSPDPEGNCKDSHITASSFGCLFVDLLPPTPTQLSGRRCGSIQRPEGGVPPSRL